MILAFGEIMMRIAPPGGRRWRQALPGGLEATWGGGEANVCVSLAILGQPVRYLTALPRHPLTQALQDSLRGLGVDTKCILWRESGRLGIYFVERGANQRGSSVVYDRLGSAIGLAAAGEYDFAAALRDVQWLHVTGITPAISENAFEANLELVRRAKQAGATVSCDLNFRKKLWNWSPHQSARQLAQACMSQLLPSVDLVIGNEEDAADVLDIHAADTNVSCGELNVNAYRDVAERIVERFPQISRVAITLRESISANHNNWGGMLFEADTGNTHFAPLDQQQNYAPYPIRDIVDRVGAGDSFAAGLIHALNTDRLADPALAIRFAVAASCLKHSVHGDFNYVTPEEVEALMAGQATGRVQR